MDRIHACLDGEIAREDLSPDEITRLKAYESTIAEATAMYAEQPVPDLTGRIMASLPPVRETSAAATAAAPSRAPWAELIAWMWTPWRVNFTIRPAYGLAGVAALLAGALVLAPEVQEPARSAPAYASADGDAPRLYVQFRLEAPGASQVELAGSFTEWEPSYQLRESAPGVWSALVPLEPGVHDYTFVIDGQRWVIDPYAPQVPDSFGGSNSRLFLPAPAERA